MAFSVHDPEQAILKSWDTNAMAWTQAVRNREIESRNQLTNQAIIDVILAQDFQSMLDVGCGEGWLIRAISSTRAGVYVGIDGSQILIEQAIQLDPNNIYLQRAYQTLSSDSFEQSFDLIVCNFSLFGKESVHTLLANLKNLLTPQGKILIQTLFVETEETGWQPGSWQGFSDNFTDPAPWYKRNQQAWLDTFEQAGLVIIDNKVTQDSTTKQIGSVIFTIQSTQWK